MPPHRLTGIRLRGATSGRPSAPHTAAYITRSPNGICGASPISHKDRPPKSPVCCPDLAPLKPHACVIFSALVRPCSGLSVSRWSAERTYRFPEHYRPPARPTSGSPLRRPLDMWGHYTHTTLPDRKVDRQLAVKKLSNFPCPLALAFTRQQGAIDANRTSKDKQARGQQALKCTFHKAMVGGGRLCRDAADRGHARPGEIPDAAPNRL